MFTELIQVLQYLPKFHVELGTSSDSISTKTQTEMILMLAWRVCPYEWKCEKEFVRRLLFKEWIASNVVVGDCSNHHMIENRPQRVQSDQHFSEVGGEFFFFFAFLRVLIPRKWLEMSRSVPLSPQKKNPVCGLTGTVFLTSTCS